MAMEGTISTLNKAADSMAPEAIITLQATEDKFGGVIIDSQDLPKASVFLASLKHSLLQWGTQVFGSGFITYRRKTVQCIFVFLLHHLICLRLSSLINMCRSNVYLLSGN